MFGIKIKSNIERLTHKISSTENIRYSSDKRNKDHRDLCFYMGK